MPPSAFFSSFVSTEFLYGTEQQTWHSVNDKNDFINVNKFVRKYNIQQINKMFDFTQHRNKKLILCYKNAANGQYISTKWWWYLPFTLADFPDSTKAAVNKKQLKSPHSIITHTVYVNPPLKIQHKRKKEWVQSARQLLHNISWLCYDTTRIL